MPNLPHLILPRAEFNLPRKKKTGFGRPPERQYLAHGQALAEQLEEVLTGFRGRRRPAGIDPSLILRVQLNPRAGVDEEEWERCGLTLLSVDENKTLILFSSDTDLSDFKLRLSEYQQGPLPKHKSAPHEKVFASIDHIGAVRAKDRIGRLLRADGVRDPTGLEDQKEYVVDIELWDLGSRDANHNRIAELRRFIERQGGRVSDDYVGESLVLLRSRCIGKVIKNLLEVDYVALVDLPPSPTLSVSNLIEVGVHDLPTVPAPKDGAPSVAVLDSGLTTAHPLISPAVGEATTIPIGWADASDGHGHGTMVAGLALYGNVEECIISRSFVPRLTLFSARVLNNK